MMTAVRFILLLLLVSVAGCRSPEPLDNIVRAELPNSFNFVSSIGQRSASVICDDVGYYIVFDDDKRKANVTITNLHLPDMEEPMILTFTDVDMTYTDNRHEKQRIMREDVLVSSDPVTEGVAITDVIIIYTHANALDTNGNDGIYAKYTVDGRYAVTAYPYCIFADGTTIVENLSDETQIVDYRPTYKISLSPDDMTAWLFVEGLKLGGTSVNLSYGPLRLSIDDSGYSLSELPSTVLAVAEKIESFALSARLLDELKVDFVVVDESAALYRVSGFLTPNLSE